jgi:NAD(P)H-hydrate epimerase
MSGAKGQNVSAPPDLPARDAAGHKGDYGRVLVAGGSTGMSGAAALASLAALRGGAGLVRFAVPRVIQQTVTTICPCATSTGLTCDAAGRLEASAAGELARACEAAKIDVLALGPGMDVGEGPRQIVRWALGQGRPLVLDADGLNNLARLGDWPALLNGPLVLTPHPGEFSRLRGLSIGEIQRDRRAAALEAVRAYKAERGGDSPTEIVLLLKGAGTVVTDGERVYVNATGNPGMATGGSGDVLTGLLAALWGRGLGAFEAACLAAWVHGRAGDRVAARIGQEGLIASDLLDELPAALNERVR